MSEIQNYSINNMPSPHSIISMKGESDFNIEAHTSSNMKVQRPKVTPADLTINLPVKQVFSDRDATKRMQSINTDIYEGAKKEKEKHEFNFKRFFTIFGIIALLTLIAGLRKSKGK